MKQLIIVRHANASNDDYNIQDIDRPLSEKGINDAKLVANELKSLEIVPDLILCSTAKRTRSTLKILNSVLNCSKTEYHEELYSGLDYDYMSLIKKTNDDVNSLMIVGHNPIVTSLVNNLSSSSIFDISTSCVAVLKFDNLSWKKLDFKTCNLDNFISPKNLK